jgi:hypothetical protein
MSQPAARALRPLGRTLGEATAASIVCFLESLTGEVPAHYAISVSGLTHDPTVARRRRALRVKPRNKGLQTSCRPVRILARSSQSKEQEKVP